MTTPLKLTMIGTGYVGLPTGACFADMGFDVTCVDKDAAKIKSLAEECKITIYEEGLQELVERNVKAGRLHFTTDLSTCVPQSDLVFIAVGTPQDEDGSADLSHVTAAAEEVAPLLQGYTVIVNKSTVPVGTGKMVEDVIRKANPSADFDVASNPEFLRQGTAVEDFAKPDRIVAGCPSLRSRTLMEALYQPLTAKGYPLVITSRETSELIKYAANAFLAMKITFINELADLCEKCGADALELAEGIGLDSRIGPKFLQPGPGYGGSCFPKDTNALAKIGHDWSAPQHLVETVIRSNQQVKDRMVEKITEACGGSVKGKTIAVLGLAFKAETDDMRDAPALTILPQLAIHGAVLQAYDPAATEQAKIRLSSTPITYVASVDAALQGADIAVVMTEWNQFRTLDLAKVKAALKTPALVDLRNLFAPQDVTAAGLTYVSVGRADAVASCSTCSAHTKTA